MSTNEPPILAICASALLFGAVGIVCLLIPHKVQRWALSLQTGWYGKLNPFKDFIRDPSYIATIRLIGVMATVISIIAVTDLGLIIWGRLR